ncbi:hypothetical protein TNIN_484111 [Trichonephila inaurata madagascariensis]|uniref:Uncharacterized protein n=1 Tax=Trichonephila inaurata madagascariensis TaxID=2747483 RepID=A0A8X6M811_9ARAC|nr:hypothetical protein TNIN_484111 [Trichonephila inaurata madagascariensis]
MGVLDGAVARARPTFPDVRGQVEKFFWEIERRKTSLDHLKSPKQSDFNIRHLRINRRTPSTGSPPFLRSVGLSVCLNVPRTPRPRPSVSVQVKAWGTQSVGKNHRKKGENDLFPVRSPRNWGVQGGV